MSAIAVSGLIGNPLSGLIMDKLSGALTYNGWQWLFWAEGVPSVLLGLCVYYGLDSSIAEAKWLTADEKALLAANIASEDRDKRHVRLADAFKCGRVWVLCLIYFTLMVALYGIGFWLPTIIKETGVEGFLRIGLVTATPYAVAVVGMILLSRHSDRTGERRMHYVLNVVLGCIGLVLTGLFAGKPAAAVLGLSLAMLGVVGSMPIFWAIPPAFLAGTAAAAGIGLVNSVGNLGGFVGPHVKLAQRLHFWPPASAPFYAMAAILFLSALLMFLFIPRDVHR
jgi:MFS family permease